MRVSVLALDSDVVVRADPYPHLRGAFGNYTLITAFDTKGGFARINIGVVYVQRAAVGGPVHALLVEFIARVDQTLAMRVPESKRERAAVVARLFWDQNLFNKVLLPPAATQLLLCSLMLWRNKVLLSAMAGRRLYVPDDSDAEWRRAHGGEIVAAGIDFTKRAPPPHAAAWRQPTARVAAPSALMVRPPWYPRRSEYRWVELHGAPGDATPGGAGEGAGERVLLAPPWLVSADNSLGERYKHWLYGARPTPYAPRPPPAPCVAMASVRASPRRAVAARASHRIRVCARSRRAISARSRRAISARSRRDLGTISARSRRDLGAGA